MKYHVFIRDDSGEPFAHCGEVGSSDTMKAIMDFIQSACEDLDEDRRLDISIEKCDQETIDRLPEL